MILKNQQSDFHIFTFSKCKNYLTGLFTSQPFAVVALSTAPVCRLRAPSGGTPTVCPLAPHPAAPQQLPLAYQAESSRERHWRQTQPLLRSNRLRVTAAHHVNNTPSCYGVGSTHLQSICLLLTSGIRPVGSSASSPSLLQEAGQLDTYPGDGETAGGWSEERPGREPPAPKRPWR